MSKTRILVLKYDLTNWDIISKEGYFIYSYLDDVHGFPETQLPILLKFDLPEEKKGDGKKKDSFFRMKIC
ncbi:MAG: hypothetical protein ACTSXN_04490 [Promethearchaeota archaeon]